MNVHHKFLKVDHFLTDKLSSSTFTWQQIIHLQIPLILDNLSIMFINALIMALISGNGEESVAAVALVGPISGLITCMFSAISSGSTVVVAQCLGKNNDVFLKKSIGMALWITPAIGIILCLPVIIAPEVLLNLLYRNIDPLVMEKACVYLSGNALSNIAFTIYLAIFCVLRGLGESPKCLTLSVIINVAYFLFSILFLNILDMDIVGSVYALVLARVVGALCAIVAMFVYKPSVRIKFRNIFSFQWRLFRSNLQISLPLAMEQVFASLGGIVSSMYMITLGTSTVSSNTIISSLMGFMYSPAASASNLSVTVVGRCIGAKKYDEAYIYGKRCNQISRILMVLGALVFYPILPLMLKQYHLDADAYHSVMLILLANLPFLITIWPVSTVTHSTLQAASDAMFPSIISLVALWLMNIGLGYVMAIPCGLGLWGVWIGNWAAWSFRAVMYSLRYRQKKWLYKSKLENM